MADGAAQAAFPRTVIELGEAAEATVIELFVSGDGPLLVVPIVDLCLGDAAVVSYNAIQQLGAGAWQLAHQRMRAGRDATIRTFTASLGGEYARFRTESVLAGKGGSAELLAAYLGDGTQMHDFRTLQEHGAPRTTSDLVFKGAVGGTARSVYSGLIRMRRGAKGANAFQTNRNLVLSDGAHADSVPNLDIEENDVRCSHASAVGQIDREQRFYLESRGVPPAVAERLILLGFLRGPAGRVSRRRAYATISSPPSQPGWTASPVGGDARESPTVRGRRARGGRGAPFRDRGRTDRSRPLRLGVPGARGRLQPRGLPAFGG